LPYQPFTVEQFGGLNLIADPQELGAKGSMDLLNVDFDKHGRVRSRDGYDNLTSSAAASRLDNIGIFYKTDGTKQILVSSSAGEFYSAYSSAGALIATDSIGGTTVSEADFTRFGGPSAEVVYATSWRSIPTLAHIPRKWNGTAWSTTANLRLGGFSADPHMLAVQATDNRLVGAFVTSNASRVGFSDAGVPETWGTNSYVDLTPGDGERVTCLLSWRELVFAFKETKFFVFTGNSVGAGGTSIFNYRPVNTGVGAITRQCATGSPNGVYFLSRRGIYRTTGGDPVLISRDIDPIFRGGESPFYAGGIINHAAIDKCQLTWHDERLYFAYPSGTATSNDRLLVFDPESSQWLLWDVAVNGLTTFQIGDSQELVFTYAAGSNHVGRQSSAYTDDDGTAIASHIRSGFYPLGNPGSTAYTRWTRLWGSGAPTVSVFTDMGSTDANAAAVTLGTSPAVAEGYHQQSYAGQLFSHKLSATTAWSVSKLQYDVAHVR
jgi:hypothetical protein